MRNTHGEPQAVRPRNGFTLMEIVLAIALTSVVMYLLMTAIELYMVRVDSSRSRVESAQLARTVLDQMAADITATRLYAPQAGSMFGGQSGGGGGMSGGSGDGGGGGGQSGGQSNGGGFGGSGGGGMNSVGGGASGFGGGSPNGGAASSSANSTMLSGNVTGIFGTIDQLRIDRAAYPNWQRAARAVMPEEPATVVDMPASVRYWLADGDRQTAQQLARQGVGDDESTATETHAGLYREVSTTAALADQADPLATTTTPREGAKVQLLAPEVVKMEIMYFDGAQLVETWDSFEEGALPAGVEVRLTIYEPSFQDSLKEQEQEQVRFTGQPRYRENELVEYRRFVRLPSISPAPAAEPLLPMPGNNGGGPFGGQGDRGNGGGQNGGGDGGNGNNGPGGGGGAGNRGGGGGNGE